MDTDSDSQQADKVRPSALTFQNICLNFLNVDPFITQSILLSAKEVTEQRSASCWNHQDNCVASLFWVFSYCLLGHLVPPHPC